MNPIPTIHTEKVNPKSSLSNITVPRKASKERNIQQDEIAII